MARILPAQYIIGFTDGEGSFVIGVLYAKQMKLKHRVRIAFKIHLNKKDKKILELIKNTLNCGKVFDFPPYGREKSEASEFYVWKLSDIIKYIIPFFDKNKPIIKYKDFLIFKKVAFMMVKNEHLTEEGFKKILKLREKMNHPKCNRKPSKKILNEM